VSKNFSPSASETDAIDLILPLKSGATVATTGEPITIPSDGGQTTLVTRQEYQLFSAAEAKKRQSELSGPKAARDWAGRQSQGGGQTSSGPTAPSAPSASGIGSAESGLSSGSDTSSKALLSPELQKVKGMAQAMSQRIASGEEISEEEMDQMDNAVNAAEQK
jgi:hypothetical protein